MTPPASAGCSITRNPARLAVVSPSTRTRPFTGTPPRTVSEIPSMFEPPTWIEVRAAKFFPRVFDLGDHEVRSRRHAAELEDPLRGSPERRA